MCSAAIACATALALTACTGAAEPAATPSASASPGESASPTPGTLVGRDAFALTLPKGWTEQQDAGGALLLGISDRTVGSYPMNVHVVADPTLATVIPAQLEDVRQAALVDAGATSIQSGGAFEIDGEQGLRLTYQQTVENIPVVSEEIIITRAETGFITTFSFAASVAKTERDDVVTGVMDSWTWAQ